MNTISTNDCNQVAVSNRLLEAGSLNHVDAEYNMAVLMLDCNGTIRSCSRAGMALLGCSLDKLVYRHISVILPKLEEVTLMKGDGINPNLRFLSRIGYNFDVININGVHMACALFFNEVENFGKKCLRVIFRPIESSYAAI